MPVGIGIDLGTSTSEIARYPDASGNARVIEIHGQKIVPSVVWFDDQRREILVGRDALENQVLQPDRVIGSVKRQMGKTPAELQDRRQGDPRLPIRFGGREYGPT